jgi:hypothetical protein
MLDCDGTIVSDRRKSHASNTCEGSPSVQILMEQYSEHVGGAPNLRKLSSALAETRSSFIASIPPTRDIRVLLCHSGETWAARLHPSESILGRRQTRGRSIWLASPTVTLFPLIVRLGLTGSQPLTDDSTLPGRKPPVNRAFSGDSPFEHHSFRAPVFHERPHGRARRRSASSCWRVAARQFPL